MVLAIVLEAGELIELAGITVSALKEINDKKLGEIDEKLDQLLQISSEVILRDVRSAFKAIEDYLYLSRRGEAKPEKLERIEDILQRNTGLNPEGETGGVANADIMAYSYLGLVYTHAIKGEFSLADRYILRMFETGSRLARTSLAPQVFKKVFHPLCKGTFKLHKDEMRRRADLGDHVERVGRGAAAAVVGGLGALVSIGLRTGAIGGASMQAAKNIVEGGDAKSKEWASEAKLIERHEARLDVRCREIARELLTA